MTERLPRLPRVEALIGCRLSEIDVAVVERMVAMRTREDTDLDFKQDVYAQSGKAHQDAATDVAAMAKGPGGAIFLGVRDDDGAAVEITPVAFSEVTELRLRQAIVSQAAPAPSSLSTASPWPQTVIAVSTSWLFRQARMPLTRSV